MRSLGQILLVVAAIAVLASNGRGQVTSSKDVQTVDLPAVASLNATLLVLEMDWSKSPTAKEVESELQVAFSDLTLDATHRQNLLVYGPQILFDRSKALYYTHEHLNELIPWLDHHKLIRGRIDGTQATIREVSSETPDKKNGGQSDWPVPNPRRRPVNDSLRQPCVVVRDDHLLPFPNQLPDQGPFVKFSQSKFWLVTSTQEDGQINVVSRLMYSADWREWGEPSNDKIDKIKASIDSRLMLLPGHAAILSAAGLTDGRLTDGQGHLNHWLNSLVNQMVLPILVITTEKIRGAQPTFRLPDRVKMLSGIGNPSAKGWFEIVTDEHSDASTSIVPDSSTPPQNQDVASPHESLDASSVVPRAVEPLVASEAVSIDTSGETHAATTSSIADLKLNYDAQERRIVEIARELSQNPAKAKDLDEKLRAAVAEAFTMRQQLHRAELSEFQQRMQKIQELIQTRNKMKDQIIDRRIQELRHRDLMWDAKAPNKKVGTIRNPNF